MHPEDGHEVNGRLERPFPLCFLWSMGLLDLAALPEKNKQHIVAAKKKKNIKGKENKYL